MRHYFRSWYHTFLSSYFLIFFFFFPLFSFLPLILSWVPGWSVEENHRPSSSPLWARLVHVSLYIHRPLFPSLVVPPRALLPRNPSALHHHAPPPPSLLLTTFAAPRHHPPCQPGCRLAISCTRPVEPLSEVECWLLVCLSGWLTVGPLRCWNAWFGQCLSVGPYLHTLY